MPSRFATRLTGRAFAAAACMALLAAVPSLAADGWPTAVDATYDVEFNGINVGSYSFASAHDGQTYKLTSSAKLSLLLGALRWTGDTQATGLVSGDSAKPKSFGFNYQAQSKAGSTRMAFTGDTVTQVLQDPPTKIKEGFIPVQESQLKGVLDPLSAVLAISAGGTGDPCHRRIPIYDGTQRFDLALSPKGHIALEDRKPSGQPTAGIVCRVRYIPIAGYRPDDSVKYMAHNNDIEIVLRPLPNANIFIPYKITIPTIAGAATLTARRVNVTTNTQQQIALGQ